MDYPHRDVPNACNAPGDADGIRQIKHHYYVGICNIEYYYNNIPWGQKLGSEIRHRANYAIKMCILLNCSGASGLHYWGNDHREQQEQDPNFDEKIQKYCSLVEYFGIKINPKENRIEEFIHPYLLGYYFSDKETRSKLSILSGLPLDLDFPAYFQYDGRNIKEIIEKGEGREHIQAAKLAGFYYHSVEELENEPEEVFLAKKQKLIDYYSSQDTTMAQPSLNSANVPSNHSSTQDTTIKQPVVFSTFCVITTIMCLIMLVGCTFIIPESWWQIGWGAFISILLIICLYYMPISIRVDKNTIHIIRSLKIKTIPLSEVASIQPCPPTMGAIRICGSGGFFGYWGWFKERDLGKYFAYYGKSSDCFLVKLHNGRKYILGCKNAPKIVEYISNLIK